MEEIHRLSQPECHRHSPYNYVMHRRLSESAKELVGSGKKIIDVAFEYQFNNPETYSRAFQRMFGVLPNQVKKSKNLPQLKLQATLEYIEHINKGDYLKPDWTLDKSFTVIRNLFFSLNCS